MVAVLTGYQNGCDCPQGSKGKAMPAAYSALHRGSLLPAPWVLLEPGGSSRQHRGWVGSSVSLALIWRACCLGLSLCRNGRKPRQQIQSCIWISENWKLICNHVLHYAYSLGQRNPFKKSPDTNFVTLCSLHLESVLAIVLKITSWFLRHTWLVAPFLFLPII